MDPRKPKQIIFDQEVRNKIDRGLYIAYRAVSTTLGSKGRNVMYELNWGFPNIIHDGVTVAREIVLKDPVENMAAQLLLSAAQKTNDEAGDGTTTATILTYAIAHEGLRVVSAGTNPAFIRKGIEKAVDAVIQELKAQAKPVRTHEEIAQVATISAADPALGELIATAIEKVGENGVVTVQDGTGNTVDVEYKEGMEFDRGFISPWLMTDGEKMEAVLQGNQKGNYPYVIIVNDTLSNEQLVNIIELVYKVDLRAKIIVIADDFDSVAIGSIVLTKTRGKKELVAVKAPDYGDHRTNLLNDIATVTGGTMLGGSTGIPLDQATIDSFGRCERVIVGREITQLIGGQGNRKAIDERIAAIRNQMDKAKTPFEKDKLETRLSKLVGGVAVINVAASSETEMRELKERIIDAKNAARAAVEEGIVPGGGVALLRARRVIDTLDLGREKIGAEIVKAALAYPIQKLIKNSGADSVDYIVGKIEHSTEKSLGYNVDTEDYVDLIKEGIIDPLKVSKSALTNAASIATMLITTDVAISFEREKPKTNTEDIEGIGQFPD